MISSNPLGLQKIRMYIYVNKNMKYYTYEELLPYLGKELKYETPLGVRVGIMTHDDKKEILWLPYCGLVKATTVKIELRSCE